MKKISLFLLAFMAALLSAEHALACSCGFPQIDTEEKFRAVVATALKGANAVFSGEVIEIDRFTVRFKVESVWKGDVKDELTMITGTVMTEDGSYLSSTCDYNFESGKKYLIFAHGSNDKLKADKCSWTNILSERERFVNELDRLKHIETDSQSPKAMVDLFHLRRNLTAHSTGLAISKSFIFEVDCSPVNSGVRTA